MSDLVYENSPSCEQDEDILEELDLLDNSLFNFNFNFSFNPGFFSSGQTEKYRSSATKNGTTTSATATGTISRQEIGANDSTHDHPIASFGNASLGPNATNGRSHTLPKLAKPSYFESYIAEHMVFGIGTKLELNNTNVPHLPPPLLQLDRLLDIDSKGLPHRLTIEGLPMTTRVENQLNLRLSFSPALDDCMVYLPTNCIARQKFYLNEQSSRFSEDFEENLLSLNAFLLTDNTMRPVEVCPKCVRREQKRASRRKSGLSDNLIWCNDPNRSAVVFNTRQLFAMDGRSFKLITRILCYCRHHNSPSGFRLLFVVTDSKGNVLAKTLTAAILITDKKQLASTISTSTGTKKIGIGSGPPIARLSNPTETTTKVSGSLSPDVTDSCTHSQLSYVHMSNSYSEDNSDSMTNSPIHTYHGYSSSTSMAGPNLDPMCDAPVFKNENKRLCLDPSINYVAPTHSSKPRLEHIIPAKGPVIGGVEVTLLGSNFKEGLVVKFGENIALATHCWNDSTIVALLPPAQVAGPVPVTVLEPSQGESMVNTSPSDDNSSLGPMGTFHQTPANLFNMTIFTYVDDTDRQLIELALQIVGLQMNGRLEDPRSIATKIVCSDNTNSNSGNVTGSAVSRNNSNGSYYNDLPKIDSNMMQNLDFGSDAPSLVIKIIKSLTGTQRPNLSVCDPLGRTLLHLAAYAGYFNLVSALIKRGARIEVGDAFGYTPLHFAVITGDFRTIRLLFSCQSGLKLEGLRSLYIANNYRKSGESRAYNEVLWLFDNRSTELFHHLVRVDSDASMFSEEDQYLTGIGPRGATTYNQKLYCNGTYYPCTSQDNFDLADVSDNNSFDSAYEADETASTTAMPSFTDQNQKWQSQVALGYSEQLQDHAETEGQQGQRQPVWHAVNKFFSKLNDELPCYEDLFPSSINGNAVEKLTETTASEAIIEPETPLWDAATDSSISSHSLNEVEGIKSDEDEVTERKFYNLFRKNRIHFENDKMLLFFWLPLAFFLIGWAFIIKLSRNRTQSILFEYSQSIEDYLVIGAAKLVLGKNRIKRVWLEKQPQLFRVGAAK